MSKRKIEISKEQLLEVILEIEGETGLEGGITELSKRAADLYNKKYYPEKLITYSVVGAKIREWNIPIKTKRARRAPGGERKPRGPIVRKPRSQKFQESGDAQKSLAYLRKNTPARFHNIVDQIAKGSRAAAVKLNCIECSGWMTAEVRKCEITACPMYLFRPYQGKIEADEDTQTEQETEE